jgi:predicted molibdopterin-dependent oxidoreductase YjgC
MTDRETPLPAESSKDGALLARRIGRPPGDSILSFTFDGYPMSACDGETVAAALLAAGRRAFRFTERGGRPRGFFCGMGVCLDCLVRIDGRPNARACQIPVAEGMRVETQRGASSWEAVP